MLSEAHERLWSIIPYGKKNAMTRSHLVVMLDMSDRKVRAMIHDLRAAGKVICSDTQGKGYWKPTKRQEVQDFIDQMDSYGKQCFNAAKSARKYMADHEDQLHF